MALIYYNREIASFPLEQGYWYDVGFDIDEIKITKFNEVEAEPENFAKYETIFVIELYSPSPQARLFLSDEVLEERHEKMSERRRIERFLDVECQPVHTGILILHRCH